MNTYEKSNNKALPPCGGRWRGVIILGDGMADHKVSSLGNKTPLEAANIPTIDLLAKEGKTGRLITVPEGFPPGSEVANTCILGYDMEKVYEGRGPLEAASIGYEMQPDDFAIRCNIIALKDGKIQNHHGNHLQTEDARVLIEKLNTVLGGEYTLGEKTAQVQFIPGIQYRHLLIIKGGNKNITCAPPHDHPGEEWRPLLVKAAEVLGSRDSETSGFRDSELLGTRMPELSPAETADLLNDLILKSQKILNPSLSFGEGRGEALLSIWPWSGGYRPSMQTLLSQFPQISRGSVISAVDLIKGIGHYAGLRVIEVPGATGLADTNYEGKAAAAIEALKSGDDFVFLHVEASDEAGHDGDVSLKVKTIEYLDRRIIKPIHDYALQSDEPITIAVLPDHPTPVEQRIHVNEPVPFLIWNKNIQPDDTQEYSEQSCVTGAYGLLRLRQFIETFMQA